MIRNLVLTIVYHLMVALIWVGHVVVQCAGAVDAYVAALIGMPRLAYTGRRFATVMRQTRQEEL